MQSKDTALNTVSVEMVLAEPKPTTSAARHPEAKLSPKHDGYKLQNIECVQGQMLPLDRKIRP
jgi:hypothetical protein